MVQAAPGFILELVIRAVWLGPPPAVRLTKAEVAARCRKAFRAYLRLSPLQPTLSLHSVRSVAPPLVGRTITRRPDHFSVFVELAGIVRLSDTAAVPQVAWWLNRALATQQAPPPDPLLLLVGVRNTKGDYAPDAD